ncbi:hypothetical protein LXA43DRAFT_1063881 [Ganoderma leucocontextum]|nr:hypothetical protein LXA43DRAFT_1063881 [Ganoderma leucocontextum]
MDLSLCRFVLWRRNNELPIWRVVPFTPGCPIRLCDLPWLAATCNDILGLTVFEHFAYEFGEWTVEPIHNGEVAILADSPIVLLRVQGVELCPLLGYELASFDRNLGHRYEPTSLSEIDNRFDDSDALRHLRVVAWTAVRDPPSFNGEAPKIHRISFNDDNTIKLVRHYYLHKDLARRETVNLWVPGGEWEGGVSVSTRFWVEARYNSILVKLTEVNVAIGLGQELIALEPVGKVRRGPRKVYVSFESYLGLTHCVNPVYDIAVPAEMLAWETYGRMQEGEGWNWGGNVADETLTIDYADVATDSSTIPRKREADGDHETLRPSRRTKLSSSS